VPEVSFFCGRKRPNRPLVGNVKPLIIRINVRNDPHVGRQILSDHRLPIAASSLNLNNA
jgi:hypothetical protein